MANIELPPPSSFVHPDAWMAYATEVNPGSSVQFVSPTVGWRVDETPAPYLDRNIGAGPGGAEFAWPGAALSETTDGGSTWTVAATDSTGYWGVDFVSPSTGWAVGVTSLRGTTDGGTNWHTLTEPSGRALVTVQFLNTDLGYGLTTDGGLVDTSDGGASWQPVGLKTPADSLCFVSPSLGYVASANGSVLETTDSGAAWEEVHATGFPRTWGSVWPQLTCNAQEVWEATEVFDPNLPVGVPYVVEARSANQPWKTVAEDSYGEPHFPATAADNKPFPTLGGVALSPAGTGSALLAGVPSTGQGLTFNAQRADSSGPVGSTQYPGAGGIPANGSIDQLTVDASAYLRVIGETAAGPSDAWIYAIDSAVGSPGRGSYELLTLRTTDGGEHWATVASQISTQPNTTG